MALRVLHLIKQLRRAGAERVVLQITQNLPDEFDMHVCAFRDGPTAEELRAVGAEVTAFFPPDTRFSRLRAMRRLGKHMAALKPDIVHCHMLEANLMGGWMAARQRVPFICHVHGPAEWELSAAHRTVCKHGYRHLASRGGRFVAVSRGVADAVMRLCGINCTVVHNGVDLNQFRRRSRDGDLRGQLGLAAAAPLVGTVGRLAYQKNPQCLVRAIPAVLSACPEAQFVLVGNGPLTREVEGLARTLGVRAHLHLLGMRDDVPDLLPQLDVFALPSRFEGLPLCFAEAMACGLGVIGTDVVGVNEIVVDGETGFLVPSEDHEALATRIVQLLRDEALRRKMGEAGRRRVEEHFSIPRMIEQVVAIYDELLQEPGAGPA